MPHRHAVALAAALAGLAPAAGAADLLDPTPRIAVMSAFAPEWTTLKAEVENPASRSLNGTEFILGKLGGKDVALFLSGVSMVNAAMTTQLALDHLEIRGIVFSGIAGGVDPDLAIGDVTVPAQWGQYLEMVFARKTADGFAPPPWVTSQFPPYGMMYVRDQDVTSARQADVEYRFWFPVDPGYLATAEKVAAGIDLVACNPENKCLSAPPKIVVGGAGVSGSAFVDNAEFRDWAFRSFEAHVLDMESAAVAHVAYVNEVPFIAFRSLSDLAGGGPGENEMETFMSLAATNSAAVVTRFLAALD
jgi:adenosylhomocysteine nucleosidase